MPRRQGMPSTDCTPRPARIPVPPGLLRAFLRLAACLCAHATSAAPGTSLLDAAAGQRVPAWTLGIVLVALAGGLYLMLAQHRRVARAMRELAARAALLDQRQEELQFGEESLRVVIENSPYIVTINRLDADGALLDANPAFLKSAGFSSRDQVLGMSPRDYAGIDNETVQDLLRELQHNGRVKDRQLRLRRRNGGYRYILLSSVVLPGEGEPRILSMMVDITQKVEAEEALRVSETKYRELVLLAADGILVGSADGVVTDANRSASQILGLPTDSVLGRHFADLFPTGRPDESPLRGDLLSLGAVLAREQTIGRPDGSLVWVELHTKRMPDGGFQSLVRDVTDRKRIEANLREKTTELERFFASAMDLLSIIDMQGCFVRANRQWEQVLGYPEEELVGHPVFELIHPDDLEAAQRAMAELKNARPALNCVGRYRARDGNYRVLEWRCIPHGSLIHSTARDITERIRTEEALRHSEATYREVFNAVHDAIFILDTQTGKVVDANQRTYDVLGCTPDQVRGRSVWEFNPQEPPYTRERSEELNRRAAEGEPLVFEWKSRHADGRGLWVEVALKTGMIAGQERLLAIVRDITERKREKEALLRTQFAMDHAGDGIVWVDDDARIVYANDAICRTLGYTRDELLSMTAFELDPFRDAGRFPSHKEELKELGSISFETCHRAKDGHMVPVEVTTNHVESGGRWYACAFSRDITERRRQRESLERTQFAMDHARDNITWMDGDGRITYVNDSACRSLEYSREELLTMTVFQIDPDFPDNGWEQHKRELSQFGYMSFESRHTTKSGRTFPVEVTCNHCEYGGKWFACAFDHDISNRRRREEELDRSRRMLRDVVDTIPVRVFWKDLEGRYVGCNQPFAADAGRPDPESVVGEDDFALFNNGAAKAYRDDDRLVVDQGCGKIGYEETLPTASGQTVWIRTSKVPLRDGRGNIYGVLGVYEDITDRKNAEQQLAAKNRELEQIVYVASHDLRSPLVNIDGYGRELAYSMEAIGSTLASVDGTPNEQLPAILADMDDALHHIRHSTRQMDALLKGLLKVSRSGRTALTIQTVDMNAILSQVIASLGFQAKAQDAELSVAGLPPCMGDPVQLTQVFSNLVGNALKYLDPERPGKVSVSAETTPEGCVYCVEDNGVGIAPQHQQVIFELFHRLDPRGTEGEGLGLTIVQQIIGRIGGKIRVESQINVGSRFYVTLPSPPTA